MILEYLTSQKVPARDGISLQYNVSSTQNTQVTTTFNYIDINKQKIV